MRAMALCFIFVLGLLLAGCGGGGGGGTTPAVKRSFTTTIHWPDRSRFDPGTSALSGRVTLSGSAIETPVVVDFDRDPTKLGDYTQTVTTGKVIPAIERVTVKYQFFSQPGQGGVVVSEATTLLTFENDNVEVTDLALQHTVTRVVVSPNQVFTAGTPAEIAFQALDRDGAIVPVTPGSVSFTLSPAGLATMVDGKVIVDHAGTLTIQATVDGIASVTTQAEAKVPTGEVEVPFLVQRVSRDGKFAIGVDGTNRQMFYSKDAGSRQVTGLQLVYDLSQDGTILAGAFNQFPAISVSGSVATAPVTLGGGSGSATFVSDSGQVVAGHVSHGNTAPTDAFIWDRASGNVQMFHDAGETAWNYWIEGGSSDGNRITVLRMRTEMTITPDTFEKLELTYFEWRLYQKQGTAWVEYGQIPGGRIAEPATRASTPRLSPISDHGNVWVAGDATQRWQNVKEWAPHYYDEGQDVTTEYYRTTNPIDAVWFQNVVPKFLTEDGELGITKYGVIRRGYGCADIRQLRQFTSDMVDPLLAGSLDLEYRPFLSGDGQTLVVLDRTAKKSYLVPLPESWWDRIQGWQFL